MHSLGNCDKRFGISSSTELISNFKKHSLFLSVYIIIFQFSHLDISDGFIYAVGGYDGSSHMSSVERYDPEVSGTGVQGTVLGGWMSQ